MKKVRDEIENDLDISDIVAIDIQEEILGPIFLEEYRKQVAKRRNKVKYMDFSTIYNSFVSLYFESFLTTEVHLVENNVQLVLDEYNSSFITYESQPGVSFSKVFLRFFQGFFNLNMKDIKTLLILNLETLL